MRQLSPVEEGFRRGKGKSRVLGPGKGGGTQPHREMGQARR